MLFQSQPFWPGQSGALIAVLRPGCRPVGLYMDPPTAAAFQIERIDELRASETMDLLQTETADAPALRIVLRNRGATPAAFRAQIDLMPDLSALELQLGNAVDAAWREARDRFGRLSWTRGAHA